jgi:N12 class adenine-specific DNA methylase
MDETIPDSAIRDKQAELNRLYDSFTEKHGLISSRGNKLAFSEDSSYCLLCSLEVLDEQGNLKRKADMFTRRTIRPHVAVTSVDTASEALAVSISEKARVDMDYMAELSGKSPEELERELEEDPYADSEFSWLTDEPAEEAEPADAASEEPEKAQTMKMQTEEPKTPEETKEEQQS